MRQNVESRLRRLEVARLPPNALFYLAWSEQAVAEAEDAGTLRHGDVLVRGEWMALARLHPHGGLLRAT